MNKNFIIGSVWTALIVGVISFVVTVNFLDNDLNNSTEKESYQETNASSKKVVYETNQSSVRTNNLASVDNLEIKKGDDDNSLDKIIENNIKNQIKNDEEIDAEELNEIPNYEIAEASNVISFVKPINGDVLKPLAINELAYSKTLKEWCIHKGTDYKAQLGDEVYAVRKGTVKEINSNSKYGEYIVIDFGDDYEGKYYNVTVLDALQVGQELQQGQVIGYVAESYGFEVEEETHLHFELKKDKEYISI